MAIALNEAPERYQFSVGVDLGQARDPSAIAIIRDHFEPASVRNGGRSKGSRALVHLDRFGIEQSYTDQIAHIGRVIARPPVSSWGDPRVGFDATGVGRAVCDLAREKGVRHTPLTITAGSGFSEDREAIRVGKSLLVGRLLTALHDRALLIAAGVPYAETLKRELSDFRVRFTDSGNAVFGAREGAHDDLVLAVAIALWMADRKQHRFVVSSHAFAIANENGD